MGAFSKFDHSAQRGTPLLNLFSYPWFTFVWLKFKTQPPPLKVFFLFLFLKVSVFAYIVAEIIVRE
jgi:hypothetical protein